MMKKTLMTLLFASTVGISAVGLVADEYDGRYEAHDSAHHGDRDRDDDRGRGRHEDGPGSAYLSDSQYGLYKSECGSDVGSFGRCETCHRGAEQGDFDEHGVRIPGYGRWDD